MTQRLFLLISLPRSPALFSLLPGSCNAAGILLLEAEEDSNFKKLDSFFLREKLKGDT